MDLSGIIFVVLALAWAVFLIPKALQRHDEEARSRSIDRFSSALRVLAHREPTERNGSRLVVSPGRPVARRLVTTATRPDVTEVTSVEAAPVSAAAAPEAAAPEAAADTAAPAAAPPASGASAAAAPAAASVARPRTAAQVRARRAAARAAARRRRRILTFLLLCTAVTAVVAGLAFAPWWAVAVPGGLSLAYLVLCRTQVRHESAPDLRAAPAVPAAGAAAPESVAEEAAPEPAAEDAAPESAAWSAVPAEAAAEVSVDEHRVGAFEDEDTIGVPVAVLQAAAAQADSGSTLWDPLPVTLPTYVTKPRAQRTVRTIELGEPGTWTSGRTAEDAQIAAQAADSGAAASGRAEGGQHAVGS